MKPYELQSALKKLLQSQELLYRVEPVVPLVTIVDASSPKLGAVPSLEPYIVLIAPDPTKSS